MNKTSAPLTQPENSSTGDESFLNPSSNERPQTTRRESTATARINNADKTCQTLIDFQPKNSNLPEWRLQIQNTVRQRKNAGAVPVDNVSDMNGMPIEQPRQETAKPTESPAAEAVNATVASALRRIERSRQIYSGNRAGSLAVDQRKFEAQPQVQPKPVPFTVISPSAESLPVKTVAESVAVPKPKLVKSFKIEKKSYDTNKLPPLEEALNDLHKTESPDSAVAVETFEASKPVPRSLGLIDDLSLSGSAYELPESVSDNVDDFAPVSVRMLAGFFDFIIIGVASVILLSPFISGSDAWLSLSGGLAFASTFSILMFLYLTACIGGWGRSFGMRLFSLELIDAEENAYPSIHQSAVNSAVFLLSVGFAGLGFLPMLFNRENRALHDIVSGTIMIRDH